MWVGVNFPSPGVAPARAPRATPSLHPSSQIVQQIYPVDQAEEFVAVEHERDVVGAEDRQQVLEPRDGLVRLSVGIEDVDDIIADLDQALEAA